MAKYRVSYHYASHTSFIVEADSEDAAFEKVWNLPETQERDVEADDIKIRKAPPPKVEGG